MHTLSGTRYSMTIKKRLLQHSLQKGDLEEVEEKWNEGKVKKDLVREREKLKFPCFFKV